MHTEVKGNEKLGEINTLRYGRHTVYFHLAGFYQGTNIYFAFINSKLSH